MVVDVSSPQTPVLYASPSIDITKEIIELYDKSTASLSEPRLGAKHLAAPAPAATPKPAHQAAGYNSRAVASRPSKVELASGRKLRDRNKPAYRLAHWPIWIFVFFIAPGHATFDSVRARFRPARAALAGRR